MTHNIRPLSHIKVVDFGTGLAGALVGRILSDLGAAIHRAECTSGDPFYHRYSAYRYWQEGKNIQRFADTASALQSCAQQLEAATICLIGGEDFPGYDWTFDANTLARDYPKLVILEISGGGAGNYDAGLVASDLLVQARTGLIFEQSDGQPAAFAFPAGAYGAALHGLTGAFTALCEHETSGRGQVVRTSLFEGTLAWLSHDWFQFEKPNEVSTDVTPKSAIPLIFECSDGRFVHIILASTDSRKHLFTLLGVENPDPPLDVDPRGMPSNNRPPRYYYENTDMLAPYVARWDSEDLLAELWKLGVSAEMVMMPGEVWDEEQVQINRVLRNAEDSSTLVGLPFDYRTVTTAKRARAGHEYQKGASPLSGVNVVDFGTFTAGPHSSIVLADLGAEVIKIEPIGGDPMRFYFLKFTGSSRGKKIIELNLKTSEGQTIARKICAEADIVHHNFRPGVTQRLGIDEASLRKDNPDLLMFETSAYGQSGPKASYGGFDMIFHSFCGHSVRCGGREGPPRNYRLPIVDFSSGLFANLALAVGYYTRLHTGNGATITTSLLNCGLYLLSELVRKPDMTFAPLPELDAEAAGYHPAERIYPVGRKWIAIAALDETMAQNLVATLKLDAKINLPREQWGPEQTSLIADAIIDHDPTEILAELNQAGIWAELCRDDAAACVFADPAMRSNGTVVHDNDPDFGSYLQLGALVRFSRSITTPSSRSPRRGSDTRAILNSLGYDNDVIDSFYRSGIVA